ncbi:MAG: outer membrane beta-barrel protein [Kiritimatiellae bacterium]|nr:outer membrane beta-barrel protein [Kiritimatiellia bacterium]
MRKLLTVLAVLALSVPMALGAGGLGVFGSYWDMDDADDPAIGGGIKFKMEMAPPICLELRASYLQEFGGDIEGSDFFEDATMVPLEADVVVDFPIVPDTMTIYGGAGAGYYILPEFEGASAIPGSDEPDVDPDDEFGFFVVGGAELMLNEQVALFGEVKYTWLEIDEIEIDDTAGTLPEDFEFTGLGFNAGLMFTW